MIVPESSVFAFRECVSTERVLSVGLLFSSAFTHIGSALAINNATIDRFLKLTSSTTGRNVHSSCQIKDLLSHLESIAWKSASRRGLPRVCQCLEVGIERKRDVSAMLN